MAKDKINNFNIMAPKIFRILIDKFGYELADIKTNELNGIKWSAQHTYINYKKELKIVIEQAPYYTDYGFSFFIQNIGTKESNVLCNVPHEKQDEEDNFLINAYDDLFSTKEMLDLISGKTWKKLNKIPFKS